MHSADPQFAQDFADDPGGLLAKAWGALASRVAPDNPVAVATLSVAAPNDELLIAMVLLLPGGQPAVAGARVAGPQPDRAIPSLLLSLGWLQLHLASADLAQQQRAAQLLNLMGHVSAQDKARAAAQEWINRMAAWVRAEMGGAGAGLSLTLFTLRRDEPRWWVSADTAWAEPGAPGLQELTELAGHAALQGSELHQGAAWAMPLYAQGEVVAVLAATILATLGTTPLTLPESTLALLRAGAGLGEPLLRHWQAAERSLPAHAWVAGGQTWRKFTGPGHLAWKALGLLAIAALAGLTLLPLPDRVTANVVVEGSVRQLVTAPFEGFVAQVLVRPGERVTLGQLLLRLDDRDLRLEQAKAQGERETAASKLRVAMAERDASAMALAQADLAQAKAQLSLVEAKLARSGLRAPLAGLVVSGDWVQQIGTPVETGKELFEIAATDAFKVVLHVPERDIARVEVGQRGVLRLAGQPASGHGFEVARVTATASVQEGVNGFRVEAVWRDDPSGAPPPALSPGLQGIGKIEVGMSNLLTIWARPSLDWLRMKVWTWWW